VTEILMDDDSDSRLQPILWIALASIAIGGTIDLLMDKPADWLSFHVIFETTMIAGALLMATTLWLGWSRAAQSLQETRDRLAVRHAERDAWRESARRAFEGLSAAIDEQFDAWDLTPAEREVALLLLKGYSHKHVAAATGRSERTARQHAAAVYEKAGLHNRAELSAYFLDDLLSPAAR
jgi:DNA-binding CsgD family transcriptional regulator